MDNLGSIAVPIHGSSKNLNDLMTSVAIPEFDTTSVSSFQFNLLYTILVFRYLS